MSSQRQKRIKMTSADWEDAADLFEQAAYMADDSKQTHSKSACDWVTRFCNKKAVSVQGKAKPQ